VQLHTQVYLARRGDMKTEGHHMLELRPSCECCHKDLPPAADDAMICTFECTFCRDCTETKLHGICPNCSGDLQRRPIRPESKLAKFPASTKRVEKPEGCAAA
jgi:uncharacterized protein